MGGANEESNRSYEEILRQQAIRAAAAGEEWKGGGRSEGTSLEELRRIQIDQTGRL